MSRPAAELRVGWQCAHSLGEWSEETCRLLRSPSCLEGDNSPLHMVVASRRLTWKVLSSSIGDKKCRLTSLQNGAHENAKIRSRCAGHVLPLQSVFFRQIAKTDLPREKANTRSMNRDSGTRKLSQNRIWPVLALAAWRNSRLPAEARIPKAS